MLVHRARWPGAFNRPAPEQVEIPDCPAGGLRIGEAHQEQRLNAAEEDLSHDDGSTNFESCTRSAKPAPRIMAVPAPTGYPMRALILRKALMGFDRIVGHPMAGARPIDRWFSVPSSVAVNGCR